MIIVGSVDELFISASYILVIFLRSSNTKWYLNDPKIVQFLEQLKSILVSKTFGLWPNRQLCLTNLTLSDSKTEKNLNVRIVQKMLIWQTQVAKQNKAKLWCNPKWLFKPFPISMVQIETAGCWIMASYVEYYVQYIKRNTFQ